MQVGAHQRKAEMNNFHLFYATCSFLFSSKLWAYFKSVNKITVLYQGGAVKVKGKVEWDSSFSKGKQLREVQTVVSQDLSD